jgi:hypothetical protein
MAETKMPGFPLTSQLIGSDIGWNGPDATASQQAFYTLANQILTLQNQLAAAKAAAFPLKGVTDGSDAAAGNVGEYVSTVVGIGTITGWTSGVAKNIASISLTAGDWSVWGTGIYGATAALTGAGLVTAISLTSAGFDSGVATAALPGRIDSPVLPTTSWGHTHIMGPRRINVTSPTTIYLVGLGNFSAGTLNAGGSLEARRVR